MVGHLIPENKVFWNLYLTLRKILDIVLSKEILAHDITVLKTLIAEHHYLYNTALKQSLKPKHHKRGFSDSVLNFDCSEFLLDNALSKQIGNKSSVKWLDYKGINIKLESIINCEIWNSLPKFLIIKIIFLSENNYVFFCLETKTTLYNDHLHAFEVNE